MLRLSMPAIASVSLLALGLVVVPATLDSQDSTIGTIGAKSAWAKGGNGHGGGNGNGHGGDDGNGHAGSNGEGGGATGTDVSSVDAPEGEEGEDQEQGPASNSITNKENSSAYNASETAKADPNPNSAVAHSIEPPAGENPTGEEPTGDDPAVEEPTEGTPPDVVEDETPEEPTETL